MFNPIIYTTQKLKNFASRTSTYFSFCYTKITVCIWFEKDNLKMRGCRLTSTCMGTKITVCIWFENDNMKMTNLTKNCGENQELGNLP